MEDDSEGDPFDQDDNQPSDDNSLAAEGSHGGLSLEADGAELPGTPIAMGSLRPHPPLLLVDSVKHHPPLLLDSCAQAAWQLQHDESRGSLYWLLQVSLIRVNI